MPIVSNIISTLTSRFAGFGLPVCVLDDVVAYYPDPTLLTDQIGLRDDPVYYAKQLSSGTINFYRTSGTFSYVDATGATISGVPIPGTGLYVIPGPLSTIITDDGSEYPICEGAGDVLHDIEKGIHISVSVPVWTEGLYGNDHLNQVGYATKADYTAIGELWQSGVDGSWVVLDDNAFVPLIDGGILSLPYSLPYTL